MKVLIVCSETRKSISPFVQEQAQSLQEKLVTIDFFTIKKKGILGYIMHYPQYIKKIKNYKPDIVHAHYGLSGLFANLQRSVPVVTTYHGCDINRKKLLIFSKISILLTRKNIFVSKKLAQKAGCLSSPIISCGVNFDVFKPMDKKTARQVLGFNEGEKYVLFSGAFDNVVKNYPLAQKSVEILRNQGYNIELLEYKGYTHQQAAVLFNAVDCVLVTSFRESGPLVVKEAMAVNTPVVSVDVGDVKEVIQGIEGYYICSNDAGDIAHNLIRVFNECDEKRMHAREMVSFLDLSLVANRVIEVYKTILL